MLKQSSLVTLAVLALGGIGATQAPATFEVASVKQNTSGAGPQRMNPQTDRFLATNVSLRTLIQEAYGVYADQITNAPRWIDDERFDINAKAAQPLASRRDSQAMLRTLLTDRFKLATHSESRSATNYALKVISPDGKFGPLFGRAATDCAGLRAAAPAADPRTAEPCGMNTLARAGITGRMRVRGLALSNLVAVLEREIREPVKDETALTGAFDWELTWRPAAFATGPINRERFPEIDPDAPPITIALREQLGLELKPQQGTVSVLVVDTVEHPTPD